METFPIVRCRMLVSIAVVLCSVQSTFAQNTDADIRQRLASPSSLTADEIARVLAASRAAAANRTFHVSPSPTGTPGPEMQIGPDGGPVFIRATSGFLTSSTAQPQGRVTVTTLTHYTRRMAMYCDGSPAPGELVVDYENLGGGWTLSVRHAVDGIELLTPIFAALKGIVPLVDGGSSVVAGRAARAFSAPWRPGEIRTEEKLPGGGTVGRTLVPGGPAPPDAKQTVWIDLESLLPTRWGITMTIPQSAAPIDYGMFLVQDDRIDLHPPPGMVPPTCIDPRAPARPGRIR